MGIRKASRIVIKRNRPGQIPVVAVPEKPKSSLFDGTNVTKIKMTDFAKGNLPLSDIIDTDNLLSFADFQEQLEKMDAKIKDKAKTRDIWNVFSRYYNLVNRQAKGKLEDQEYSTQNQLWGRTTDARILEKMGYLTSKKAAFGRTGQNLFSLTPLGVEFARAFIIYSSNFIITSKKDLNEVLNRFPPQNFKKMKSNGPHERGIILQYPDYLGFPTPLQVNTVIHSPETKREEIAGTGFSTKDILGKPYGEMQKLYMQSPTHQISKPFFVDGINPGQNRVVPGALMFYAKDKHNTICQFQIRTEEYRELYERFGDIDFRVLDTDLDQKKFHYIVASVEANNELKGFIRMSAQKIEKDSASSSVYDNQLYYRLAYFAKTIFANREGMRD